MTATTTSPYNMPAHSRRTSSDSVVPSSRTSRHSISSTVSSESHKPSAPKPSAYSRSQRSYDSDFTPADSESSESHDKELETVQKMEKEQTNRMRAYSVEISKIMGRQLVDGLNATKARNAAEAAGATT